MKLYNQEFQVPSTDDDNDSTSSTEPMKNVTQGPEMPSLQHTLHMDTTGHDSDSGDNVHEDHSSEAQDCELINSVVILTHNVHVH